MKNQADLYCPAGCMDHIADVDHIFAYARAFCSENDRRACIHIGSRVWGTYPVYHLFSIFPGKRNGKISYCYLSFADRGRNFGCLDNDLRAERNVPGVQFTKTVG